MRTLLDGGGLTPERVFDVLDDLPVTVIVAAIETQTVVAVNDAGCEFFGRPRDEIVGMSISSLTAPDDRPQAAANYRRLVEDLRLRIDKRYLRGDGRIVHGRVQAVSIDDDRRLSFGVITDTTDVEEAIGRFELTIAAAQLALRVNDLDELCSGLVKLYETHVDSVLRIELDAAAGRRARQWSHAAPPDRAPDHRAPILLDDHVVGHLVTWRDHTPSTRIPAGADSTIIASLVSQAIGRDELSATTRDLAASEHRYRTLVDASPDLIIGIDADGRVVDANVAAVSALGGGKRAVAGRRLRDLLQGDLVAELEEQIRRARESGTPTTLWRQWLQPLAGRPRWTAVRVVPHDPIDDDTPGAAERRRTLLVISDVSELVESEQRLSALALVDPLTGAANRAAFHDRLQHAMDRLRRGDDAGLAVALIDLDHFKAINDTFGHSVGDCALRLTVEELLDAIRASDTVGRLGGDELAVLFEDVVDDEAATELGRRVMDAIGTRPLTVDEGVSVPRTASVGIAWTPNPVPVTDLLARADRAMYEAKRRGRGRIWTEHRSSRQPSQTAMLRELQSALDRHQFELWYQPIVDGRTGAADGVEALLRWRRHRDEVLTPDVFLPSLLASGLIGPVGSWVLRTAIEQLAVWRSTIAPDLHLHVNVSPAELTSPRLADELRLALRDDRDLAGAVRIELTEQALTGALVSTSSLAGLTDQGVGLVLDDFGTGVSSLTHLRAPGLVGVKIDRSFVAGVTGDGVDGRIVEGIVHLASGLDLAVVAEGVERDDQADWLIDIGCPAHQGWRYHPALPVEELEAVLAPPSAVATGRRTGT